MSSIVANNIAQCIDALVRFTCLISAPLILIVVQISRIDHERISEKVQDSSADTFEIAGETVRSFGNDDEELETLFYNHIKFHEYKHI
ncbi:unnamed protein product [Rotaria sp. Silwood2]|nr:unnamed protein product [Rotaria sp. Silwood2]CAF3966084.1 unnamed protein product [Rotaria sp. Silwood2]CAF4298651.1 unnamed protein product [Rotaria sp. Silwood2]